MPGHPAPFVAYIANFERAGIQSAMRTCWVETAHGHGDSREE